MESREPLPDAVVRAMDVADRRLGQPLRLTDLARAAGLSPFHFHRVFRRAAGESPARFVERLRLERAVLLLLADGTPITELAWEVGFRNPETLARRFRARFRVTARDYRRRQLELWNRLGLEPGRDPGGPGGPIAVRELPPLPVAFERTLGAEGDGYVPAPAPRASTALLTRTLDWPGITPPERVRVDRGVVLAAGGRCAPRARATLAPGPHATIELPGREPVPNRVYQRLMVWSMAGAWRLAPGPLVELLYDDRTVVHQPVREHDGGGGCLPSSASRSNGR